MGTRKISMKKFIQRWLWILTDRCSECGGELNVWSYKKAQCKICGEVN